VSWIPYTARATSIFLLPISQTNSFTRNSSTLQRKTLKARPGNLFIYHLRKICGSLIRIEFFPRKDNAQEGLITEQFYEYFEEQYEPLDLIQPVRASNPQIYDKQFTCGADEGIMSFQSEILGVEIDP
jgi:hypothetical protein